MTRSVAAAVLLGLMLCGCAMPAPEPKLPPQKGAEGVEITKQQGGRFIAFVGPRLQHAEPFLGVAGTNFFALRSWLDTRTGETAHQLYVAYSYYGVPYDWQGVRDAEKRELRFIAIGRNQISCEAGCAYFDEFAAVLPEDELKAHKNGLSLVFVAKDGKTLKVDVPGRLVAEQLVAVDTVRAATLPAHPAPVAAAPVHPAPPSPAAVPAAATPPAVRDR